MLIHILSLSLVCSLRFYSLVRLLIKQSCKTIFCPVPRVVATYSELLLSWPKQQACVIEAFSSFLFLSAFYHSIALGLIIHIFLTSTCVKSVLDCTSRSYDVVLTGWDTAAQEECWSAVFHSNTGVFIQFVSSPHRKRQCEFATNDDSLSNLSFDIWSRHWEIYRVKDSDS